MSKDKSLDWVEYTRINGQLHKRPTNEMSESREDAYDSNIEPPPTVVEPQAPPPEVVEAVAVKAQQAKDQGVPVTPELVEGWLKSVWSNIMTQRQRGDTANR